MPCEFTEVILVLRFSRLELYVQLRLSGMSHVERLKLSNVSENTALAIFRVNVQWLSVLAALYMAGSTATTPNHYIFTLKMAIAMFAETDNFQHSTRFIPERQSCSQKQLFVGSI
jgi:hypothetical protein